MSKKKHILKKFPFILFTLVQFFSTALFANSSTDSSHNIHYNTLSPPVRGKDYEIYSFNEREKPIDYLLVDFGGPGLDNIRFLNIFKQFAPLFMRYISFLDYYDDVNNFIKTHSIIAINSLGVNGAIYTKELEECRGYESADEFYENNCPLLYSKINTQNNVDNIERIRSHLENQGFTGEMLVYGLSYGARTLSQYINKYPDKVTAAVFDSPIEFEYKSLKESLLMRSNAAFNNFLNMLRSNLFDYSSLENRMRAGLTIEDLLTYREDAIYLNTDVESDSSDAYHKYLPWYHLISNLFDYKMFFEFTSKTPVNPIYICNDAQYPINKDDAIDLVNSQIMTNKLAGYFYSNYIDLCTQHNHITSSDSYIKPIVNNKTPVIFLQSEFDMLTPLFSGKIESLSSSFVNNVFLSFDNSMVHGVVKSKSLSLLKVIVDFYLSSDKEDYINYIEQNKDIIQYNSASNLVTQTRIDIKKILSQI